MNDHENRDNNSVPLNADEVENVTMQELIAALNQVCDEHESVRDDLLSRFREQARQDRIGGDWT